jgi:hypothetical protein
MFVIEEVFRFFNHRLDLSLDVFLARWICYQTLDGGYRDINAVLGDAQLLELTAIHFVSRRGTFVKRGVFVGL